MNHRKKVLITRFFPGDAIKLLEEYCDIDFCQEITPMAKEELCERMKSVDAVISMGDQIDRKMIENAPNLKVIADMWGAAGVDSEACKDCKVAIRRNTIPITWINHTEAEHAILLMLAVSRRLLEEDEFVRSGRYENYEQANKDWLGPGLYGKTLGIVGGGHWSADQLSSRAHALGMKVQYWDLEHSLVVEETGASFSEFDSLIQTSDYIVLMSNGSQGYIFDAPQFEAMNHNAILVNVTKGEFINEEELIKALVTGKVAGAGLDKFEKEPVVSEGLKKLKNVILSPHSDGALLKERNDIFMNLILQCFEVLGIATDVMKKI